MAMSDEFRKHMKLYQEALVEQRELMEQVVREGNERMDRFGADLIRIGEDTRRLGEETRRIGEETLRTGEESRRGIVESNERYSQLFGRMRLSESRLDAMLKATDHDRQELRELCQDLDRRLTEVEKRLAS